MVTQKKKKKKKSKWDSMFTVELRQLFHSIGKLRFHDMLDCRMDVLLETRKKNNKCKRN